MMLRTLICLLLIRSAACGATWYVDNRDGDDARDGRTPQTAVATIARAVALVQTSDTIVLTNTGRVYRESLQLSRRGGTPQQPLVIEGNGAVLSGLEKLPPEKWKKVAGDVYFFPVDKTPYGMPYLANAGRKLPGGTSADTLDVEQFFWDKEAGVYFRCAAGKTPAEYDLGATMLVSGLATSSASYVVCRNLVCEQFANDGFNMHGDSRGIYLENVVARYNGDDGISIHESGGLVVRGAHVHHNTFGLQDVNAARSVYNGVLSEDNKVGGSFHGGFYSLVDCTLRNNTDCQIELVAAVPKHLVGAEFNPNCRTTMFAGNAVIAGSETQGGVRISDRARAVIEHSVITGTKIGLRIARGGACHLSTSAVIDCSAAIDSDAAEVFRDYNVYYPARMRWLGVDYGPEQWEAFLKVAGHDEHSRVGPIEVAPDGAVRIPEGSPAAEIKKPVGPTAPVHSGVAP